MGEFLNEEKNIMKWRCNVGYVCHSVINVFHGGGKTVGLMMWHAMSTFIERMPIESVALFESYLHFIVKSH